MSYIRYSNRKVCKHNYKKTKEYKVSESVNINTGETTPENKVYTYYNCSLCGRNKISCKKGKVE